MATNNSINLPQLTDDLQIYSCKTGNLADVFVLSPGIGISMDVTTAPNKITISATGDVNQYVEVTGTTQLLAVNTRYTANNISLVTLTLPVSSNAGDQIIIYGKGTGLYKVAQNAGQTIVSVSGSTTTGTGGSVTALNQYGCLYLVCIVANTTWLISSTEGNFNIV